MPHSAPSWILSLAENLASSSLQDGATEWHYSLAWTPPHPIHRLRNRPTPHPPTAKLFLSMLYSVPTSTKYVSPPSEYMIFLEPNCFPPQKSMCGVPPPSICFLSMLCSVPTQLFHSSRRYVQCPPLQVHLFLCRPPPQCDCQVQPQLNFNSI